MSLREVLSFRPSTAACRARPRVRAEGQHTTRKRERNPRFVLALVHRGGAPNVYILGLLACGSQRPSYTGRGNVYVQSVLRAVATHFVLVNDWRTGGRDAYVPTLRFSSCRAATDQCREHLPYCDQLSHKLESSRTASKMLEAQSTRIELGQRRMGVEPTLDRAGGRATVLKTAKPTGTCTPPPLLCHAASARVNARACPM